MPHEKARIARRPSVFTSYAGMFDLCRRRVRLELLLALRRGELAVTSLAQERDLAISHVSRSLRELEAAELVAHRRDGRRHYYRLGPHIAIGPVGDELVLSLVADDGVKLWVAFPPEVRKELERTDEPVDRPSKPPALQPPTVSVLPITRPRAPRS